MKTSILYKNMSTILKVMYPRWYKIVLEWNSENSSYNLTFAMQIKSSTETTTIVQKYRRNNRGFKY